MVVVRIGRAGRGRHSVARRGSCNRHRLAGVALVAAAASLSSTRVHPSSFSSAGLSTFCGGSLDSRAGGRRPNHHLVAPRPQAATGSGTAPQGTAARVADVQKHIRLPVWPAWFGIAYILLDLITGNPKAGAWLEDKFGGRVCPMIFQNSQQAASPFLLVAHHRHSFNFLDPFRYIFRSVLMPEGFPAHPHRGFETVTYCLRGGLVHRDSFGVKQSYGAPSGSDGSGDDGAVQWMTAGRGMLHEEMWRTGEATDITDQELFQIWVNLPSEAKMVHPRMQMLGSYTSGGQEQPVEMLVSPEVRELGAIPRVSPEAGITVRVIAGEAAGVQSPVETYSDLAILHVTLAPNTQWIWPKPAGWNCVVYARRGDAHVGSPALDLQVHHTATLDQMGSELPLRAGADGADLIILSGVPLQEPVQMAANVVMNTQQELRQADLDMRNGQFGPVWAHTESDTDWQSIVRGHWAAAERLVRGTSAA